MLIWLSWWRSLPLKLIGNRCAFRGRWHGTTCGASIGQYGRLLQEQGLVAGLSGSRRYSSQSLVKALLDGRLAFLAGRELDAIPEVERWRREQVERRRERHFRATSLKKPAGDELWYSALARVNSEPEGVVNDFLKLVGQAGWLRAQNQGGGQRVTMAGDVLLRLGQTSAAKRAYLLSGENGFGLDHRRELADRLMLLENRGDLGTSETSSGDSMESGDATAVLTLLEGLIHFALGRKSVALETIQGIVVKGFHVYLCQWILNVLGLSNFDIEGMPAIDDFPQVLIPAFKLCHSREVLSDRVGKYIESTGAQWMTSCPLDPEIVARARIDRLCQNHKWEEAKKWLAGVSRKITSGRGTSVVLLRSGKCLIRLCAEVRLTQRSN